MSIGTAVLVVPLYRSRCARRFLSSLPSLRWIGSCCFPSASHRCARQYRCQLFIIRGCIAKALASAWAKLAGNDVRVALWTVMEKTAINALHHVLGKMVCGSMLVDLTIRPSSKTACVCGLPRGIRTNVDRLLLHKSHLSLVNIVTCRSILRVDFRC